MIKLTGVIVQVLLGVVVPYQKFRFIEIDIEMNHLKIDGSHIIDGSCGVNDGLLQNRCDLIFPAGARARHRITRGGESKILTL